MRTGLIVPSSNTVMEPDFHRVLPQALLSTTRIFLEDVTREAELRMLSEDLPHAIRLIRTTAPDVVVFGCTSAGSLGTLQHDRALARQIAEETGAIAVTIMRAVLDQLTALLPRQLAILTPYEPELTASVAASVAEGGFPAIHVAGMGIRENLRIGRVSPAEIVAFAESQLDGLRPDALFLSCTNWRSVEALDILRSRLGIPVIASNQCAIDAVRRLFNTRN